MNYEEQIAELEAEKANPNTTPDRVAEIEDAIRRIEILIAGNNKED